MEVLIILSTVLTVTIQLLIAIMIIGIYRQLLNKKQEPKKKTNTKRTHKGIKPVSYGSVIQARKNPYEIYQNKQNGLYEPRVPKKGDIPKKKGE